jgi:hypothetical protein
MFSLRREEGYIEGAALGEVAAGGLEGGFNAMRVGGMV